MNYATTLELQSWTAEIQRYSQKAIFYTPIVWGAFQKTIAPVLVDIAQGFSRHWFESECYWRQRITNAAGITYNPLTASVSAAIAELTDAKAQATYRHIRRSIREAATDALVIGLCGVVAIAEGIEVAQKVYRLAKIAYAWVDDKFNEVEPEPMILPTVEMALAHTPEDEIVAIVENIQEERLFFAKLDQLDSSALARVQIITDDTITQATIAQLKSARAKLMFREECDRADCEDIGFVVDKVIEVVQGEVVQETAVETADVCQPNGVSGYVPVVGEISNPKPTNMHQENIRMVFSQSEGHETIVQPKPKRQPKARGTSKAKATGGGRRGRAMV